MNRRFQWMILISAFIISATASATPQSDLAKLETLEGRPLIRNGYLTCMIDNDYDSDIEVRRVEYDFICRHMPSRPVHVRYRCEESPHDCEIASGDFEQFSGPWLGQCYVIDAVCWVRHAFLDQSEDPIDE